MLYYFFGSILVNLTYVLDNSIETITLDVTSIVLRLEEFHHRSISLSSHRDSL